VALDEALGAGGSAGGKSDLKTLCNRAIVSKSMAVLFMVVSAYGQTTSTEISGDEPPRMADIRSLRLPMRILQFGMKLYS
jgi:hypothetical protein